MLRYIAGPLIGALIGYFTNYIAVKMLFLPKREIRIWGHRLPFTPGAIPKGKPRLAKAIGEVVGKTLVTKEDIEEKLRSKTLAELISKTASEKLQAKMKDSLMEIGKLPEETYAAGKDKLAQVLSEHMAEALAKADLSGIIVEKGSQAVKERVQGTMLAMFLSDELIQSVTLPIGAQIQEMLAEQGAEMLKPHILEKLDVLEEQSSMEVLAQFDLHEQDVEGMAAAVFESLLIPYIGKLFDEINLAGIAEDKINDMSVDELEDLVLLVMKKELNMIVNLGAVIGLVLGTLNVIF